MSRRSAVKIYCTKRMPDFFQPWELKYQQQSSGSGCVIERQQILTCAHVVAHAMFVQVQRDDDPRKYVATVAYIDHEREVAILTVDDAVFWEGVDPVKLGVLPRQNDQVSVYGFPIGGNELAVTTGIVSRIEVRTYTHSQRFLLAFQTDAAINSGNSGGPVFAQDGSLVGLAFQAYGAKDAERTGYVIPTSIIESSLVDTANGIVEGVPHLGVLYQKIENDALRAHLGVDPSVGILVTRVVHGGTSAGVLEERDVITSIDGVPIQSDALVRIEDQRLHFFHLISRRQVGDEVALSIIRDHERMTVTVKLSPLVSLVLPPHSRIPPSYFMFAGLVFVPLSYDYMWSWTDDKMDPSFKHYYRNELPTPDRREIVLLSLVLAHDINVGYHNIYTTAVKRVNGRTIGKLQDVVEATLHPQGDVHTVELEIRGRESISMIVLDAKRVASATEEIMARHKITRDRSL